MITLNENCPKRLQQFLYFSQNQQEMSVMFSMVNFKNPACYCSAAEWYVSLRRAGESQNPVV